MIAQDMEKEQAAKKSIDNELDLKYETLDAKLELLDPKSKEYKVPVLFPCP